METFESKIFGYDMRSREGDITDGRNSASNAKTVLDDSSQYFPL